MDPGIQRIFENVFGISFAITSSTQRSDIESWDSVAHLNLIVELEDVFGISFSPDEIESLMSVKQIEDKIKSTREI